LYGIEMVTGAESPMMSGDASVVDLSVPTLIQ
jgi:hypothetical protein